MFGVFMSIRRECPWCDRIFPYYEGHEVMLLRGEWALICDACNKTMEENSGELDRYIPSLGYVRGNVDFMSRRANRVKQDFSLEEMRKLIAWMEQRECR